MKDSPKKITSYKIPIIECFGMKGVETLTLIITTSLIIIKGVMGIEVAEICQVLDIIGDMDIEEWNNRIISKGERGVVLVAVSVLKRGEDPNISIKTNIEIFIDTKEREIEERVTRERECPIFLKIRIGNERVDIRIKWNQVLIIDITKVSMEEVENGISIDNLKREFMKKIEKDFSRERKESREIVREIEKEREKEIMKEIEK